MNKKITLGLFALLFITYGVQGIALSKIQSNKALKNPANQQATVGSYDDTTTLDPSDPSNPSPQGYVMVSTLAGIQCAYLLGGHLYIGHINWDLDANNTDISTSAGCERGVRVNGFGDTPLDLTIEYPSIDSKDKILVVSGGTVPVMQFKLFVLGYLKIDQITGKLDGVTKSALMTLQKNRGLSATGVFDETTEVFLNSVLSGVKSYSVAMGGPVSFVSKNINQKAAVGSYADTTTADPSNPTPQGYITYIGANGAVLCGYIRNGSMYVGGQINGPSSPTDTAGYDHNDELYSDTNCGGARRYDGIITAPSPIDLNTTFPSIDSKDRNVIVSGSSVPVIQFKLALLGYMGVEKITGKLDDITKSAIMDFQKNRGLSATGVFDETTEIFFNSVLSGVRQSSVLTGGKFIFEDVNQKLISSSDNDTTLDPSNPTPQGFVVYTNAAGQTRCAYLTPSGALYIGGTINWNLSINSIDSPYDSRGCDGARRAYQP